jgi:hypothetical protein
MIEPGFPREPSQPPVPRPLRHGARTAFAALRRMLSRSWQLTLSLTTILAVGVLLRASEVVSQERKSDSGVTYRNDRISRVPWSIHVAKVDLSRKDLSFVATLAGGTVLGVATVSQQAKAIPPETGRAVAGVNGDFYERDNRVYAGDPRGLQIVNGELVSAPSTACVWFDQNDKPHLDEVKGDFRITWPKGETSKFGLDQQRRPNMAVLFTPTYGPSTRVNSGRDLILEREGNGPWLPLRVGETYRARVREIRATADTRLDTNLMVLSIGPQLTASTPSVDVGAVLEISTATTPDLKGAKTAIGGGPILIKNGKPFSQKEAPAGISEAYSERSKYEAHPRSAVGWNNSHFFFVEVDGRQPGLSMGMTLAELSEYMVKLGCTEGMNFDGGASATMWVLGQVVNSPCQGEKPVANALIVVRKNGGH